MTKTLIYFLIITKHLLKIKLRVLKYKICGRQQYIFKYCKYLSIKCIILRCIDHV